MLHKGTNTFPGASKPSLGSLILSYKRISIPFPNISNDSALWWTQFIWGGHSFWLQRASSQEEKKSTGMMWSDCHIQMTQKQLQRTQFPLWIVWTKRKRRKHMLAPNLQFQIIQQPCQLRLSDMTHTALCRIQTSQLIGMHVTKIRVH